MVSRRMPARRMEKGVWKDLLKRTLWLLTKRVWKDLTRICPGSALEKGPKGYGKIVHFRHGQIAILVRRHQNLRAGCKCSDTSRQASQFWTERVWKLWPKKVWKLWIGKVWKLSCPRDMESFTQKGYGQFRFSFDRYLPSNIKCHAAIYIYIYILYIYIVYII